MFLILFKSVPLPIWMGLMACALAGIFAIVLDPARRPQKDEQCSCFEYAGDNPRCPVAAHRRAYKALTEDARRPTRFEQTLKNRRS